MLDRITTFCILAVSAVSVVAQHSIYDREWYDGLSAVAQSQYDHLAQDITDFLNDGDKDFRTDDHYSGFAPVFIRAAFHASGTFHKHTNTGGLNGGTFRHGTEMDHPSNNCLNTTTAELERFSVKNQVSFADTVAIAATLGLQEMQFPEMSMIKVAGGRHDIKEDPEENLGSHLPTTGRNPMKKFIDRYGFDLEELVALVGGSHNFGSAHAKCSNYVGSWSKDPLRWSVDGQGPDFFTDMMKNDWQWFWVSQFEDDTITYTPSHDPTFPKDRDVGRDERGEQSISGIRSPRASKRGTQPRKQSAEKLQALRGCALPDKVINIKHTDSPCLDSDQRPVMRLPSDFWMLKHDEMKGHARTFADDGDRFAKAFAGAFQKMIDLGSSRCSTSGTVCEASHVCEKKLDTEGFFIEGTCKRRDEPTDGVKCDTSKCPPSWLNDGICDDVCNNAACSFDEGDCEAVKKQCNIGCPPQWLGDSMCDQSCNTKECMWDNGDCKIPVDPLDEEGRCDGRAWGDFDQCCPSYAFFGICESHPAFTEKECPNACLAGERFDAELQKDWSEDCPSLARNNHCEESPEYMLVVCKHSCAHALNR